MAYVRKPKRIVVVGGGMSGWLTATILQSTVRDLEVSLVTSPKIGTMNTIEGVTPLFHRTLRDTPILRPLLFSKKQLFQTKKGMVFEGWFKEPLTLDYKNSISGLNFDGSCISTEIAKICKSMNINVYYTEVVSIIHNRENTEICSLVTDDGNHINGDLFIDCTGFNRRIISELGVSNIYTQHKIKNHVMVCFEPFIDPKLSHASYSVIRKLRSGWAWIFSMGDAIGTGIVCRNDQTISGCIEEFSRGIDRQLKVSSEFAFESSRLEKHWIGNVAAVGNSSNFIEPMHTSNLHVTLRQIEMITDNLNWDRFDPEAYSSRTNEIYDHFARMIGYFYGKRVCHRSAADANLGLATLNGANELYNLNKSSFKVIPYGRATVPHQYL